MTVLAVAVHAGLGLPAKMKPEGSAWVMVPEAFTDPVFCTMSFSGSWALRLTCGSIVMAAAKSATGVAEEEEDDEPLGQVTSVEADAVLLPEFGSLIEEVTVICLVIVEPQGWLVGTRR